MEQLELKKVQPVLLEILKEVKRVCQENDIPYFLHGGTFLGAVRHKGFIPWDDDVDIAMLRPDYEKFRKLAPEKLGENYCFQDWDTDEAYPHPFGKVRKRNTVYIEAKCAPLQENGFYIDIFPMDPAPADEKQKAALAKKLLNLYRIKLMKCRCTPWQEGDHIIWKKRIGYLLYQGAALFTTQNAIAKTFDALVAEVPEGEIVYEQSAVPKTFYYPLAWCKDLAQYPFEDDFFPGPRNFDGFLTATYGDYMQLPPEDQRENRHQIMKIQF